MIGLSSCLKQFLPEKVEGEQQPFTKLEAVSNGTAILDKQGLANDVKRYTRCAGIAAP